MVMNRSMVDSRKMTGNASSLQHSSQIPKKEMGYSKIFHIKQQTARKTTTTNSLSGSPDLTQMYKTEARTMRFDPIS